MSTNNENDIFICQDSDTSRMLFEENFERVEQDNDDLWLYTDNSQLPDDIAPINIPPHLNTKNNVAAALDELSDSFYSYAEDIKEYTLQELIDELTDLATFDDEYTDALNDHNVKYEQPYDVITICGYCQGDCATVIVPTEALKTLWGSNNVNLNDLREYFTHVFFDAPIYFHMTYDNEEFHSSDFWSDEYIYDKGDFIDAFHTAYKKLHNITDIINYLNEQLPEVPEYV